MLRRMSQKLDQILPYIQNSSQFKLDTKSLHEDVFNAASGISDIFEFHEIPIKNFILKISQICSNANSNLDIEAMKNVAKQAYTKGYLAGYVEWLDAIISKMVEENVPLHEKEHFK